MLQQYLIGDSVEFVSVEYAKSARSTCKTCKQKIGKDELRVGLLVDDDHFSTGQGTMWFHKSCFHFKPRHKVLEVRQLNKKVHGLDSLNKKDQKQVISYLKKQLQTIKEGKGKNKEVQKKPKSKTKKTQEKQQKKQEPKHEAKSKREKSNVKPQPSKSAPKPQRSMRTRGRSILPQTQPQAQVKPKKQNKVIVKMIKAQPKKFLNPAPISQYKKLFQDYNQKTASQLKQILSKNSQPKTGTKGQLATRCADGKQFGRIPTCSKCGGGKLRFNRQKGSYACPGYMEDTDFVHCSATFAFDEVKRQEWNQ